MKENMLAAVVYGKGDVRVEKFGIPVINSNEALIKILYASICPSDLRYYNGSKTVQNSKVLGHEATGIVTKVGNQVRKVKEGDSVVINSDYKCGTCSYCRKGLHNFCTDQIVSDGCFAQYKAVPESSLYVLPEDTNIIEASCTEPLACVLNGSDKANICLGSSVAIVGAGPIGLLHLQVARLKGASQIIVIEPIELRRQKALELGANIAIDPSQVDIISEIEKCTKGQLCNSVIVSVGIPAVMEKSLEFVGNNGTIMYFAGVHPQTNIKMDPNLIHYRQITITGSSDYPLEYFELALNLIAKHQVDIKSLISNLYSLADVQEAFENAGDRKALKTVLKLFDEEKMG